MSNNKTTKKVLVKADKKTKEQAKVETKAKEATKVEPKAKSDEKQNKEPEKKSPLTKLTQKTGLNFNVSSFKLWLKNYYTDNEKYVSKPKSSKEDEEKAHKDDQKDHIPKFNGAHVALSAAVETLCQKIMKEVISHTPKDNSGLYNISYNSIRLVVALDNDLKYLFSRSIEIFTKNMSYESSFCIPRKEMIRYIDSTFGKNIHLKPEAYNLLAYLLLRFSIDVANNIYNMMVYANKKTLDFSVVMYAVKNICTGSVEHDIILKIEDARKLYNEKDDEEDQKDDTKGQKTEEKQVKNNSKSKKVEAEDVEGEGEGEEGTGEGEGELEEEEMDAEENDNDGECPMDGEFSDNEKPAPEPKNKVKNSSRRSSKN